jgi:hypothetical protein
LRCCLKGLPPLAGRLDRPAKKTESPARGFLFWQLLSTGENHFRQAEAIALRTAMCPTQNSPSQWRFSFPALKTTIHQKNCGPQGNRHPAL